MDKVVKSPKLSSYRIVSLTNWLEDCTNLYVQLIRNPVGLGFPDEKFPETKSYAIRETVRVGDLGWVLHEHAQENIWRSWQLFSDNLSSDFVSYVPVFIDIDNEERNLEAAYSLTRDCLDLLECMNQFNHPDQIRVVFSGMKGFHIEAKPSEPLDNQSIREALLTGLNNIKYEQKEIRNRFSNGVIDLGHDFIRLTESINSWKEDGVLIKRKVFQMSLEDFRRSKVQDILERSIAV
jgi:hypothetical protein